MESPERDARITQRRTVRWLLEASYGKICEDYLGVPLIQAGDSVIIKMRGLKTHCNKRKVFQAVFLGKLGGTAKKDIRPLLYKESTARDFFYAKANEPSGNMLAWFHLANACERESEAFEFHSKAVGVKCKGK